MRSAASRFAARRSEHPFRFYIPPALVLLLLFMAAIVLGPYVVAHLQALAVMKQVAGQPIGRLLRNEATEAVSQLTGTRRRCLRITLHDPQKDWPMEQPSTDASSRTVENTA